MVLDLFDCFLGYNSWHLLFHFFIYFSSCCLISDSLPTSILCFFYILFESSSIVKPFFYLFPIYFFYSVKHPYQDSYFTSFSIFFSFFFNVFFLKYRGFY